MVFQLPGATTANTFATRDFLSLLLFDLYWLLVNDGVASDLMFEWNINI